MILHSMSEYFPKNKFLLIARRSGMMNSPYEYITARYSTDKEDWLNVHNDRLTDSGYNPCGWVDCISDLNKAVDGIIEY